MDYEAIKAAKAEYDRLMDVLGDVNAPYVGKATYRIKLLGPDGFTSWIDITPEQLHDVLIAITKPSASTR